jgi:alkylation response protein AidB-like acyl-CoA dehydrogenase
MGTFSRRDQEEMEKAKDLLESGPTGDMGFAKSLFFGRLKLDAIMPYPKQDPDEARRTDEIIERVEAFLKAEVNPDQIDVEERIPPHVIEGLARLGVMGLTVPKEYGGAGLSHTAYCRVLEKISAHCASTAVLVGAHQSIGLKAIVLMGNEQQKKQFLPRLARGEILAAFCLSEPEVGSDAANVQTTARLSEDGKYWILNGQKKFATNAALAGVMTVMAKTPVAEPASEKANGKNGHGNGNGNGNGHGNGHGDAAPKMKEKVTAFIVTPDLPGFEVVSPNRSKMGVRGTWQGTLKFTNMKVPADRVLGQVGKGLKVALSVLDYGRCTLSAGCVGGAKLALKLSIEKARTRRQFSRNIGEFQLIKEKIGKMAEYAFAIEALTYLCAGMKDRHDPDLMIETTISKLFCSEALWTIADDALQIWGGEGYMREHGIERMLRDARINRIVEGATEVMTAFVALAGMKGVGEEFESVLRASRHPVGNFGRLAKFAGTQFSDVVMGSGASAGRDGRLHAELAEEGRLLAKLTTRLARAVTRVLATYKTDILDMQLVQKRIALSAVNLYAMGAVISKLQSMLAASNGTRDAALKRDLIVGKGFCRRAAEDIYNQLRTLTHNQDKSVLAVADEVLGRME